MNVVITGSTRGIGRGLAEQLLARGASVAIAGRSPDAVAAAVTELAAGARTPVVGRACDVRSPDDLQALWDLAAESLGRVDVWINNAGVSAPRVPIWQVPTDAIESVVTTNLTGSLHGSRVALRGMQRQGAGIVYNMEGFGSNGQTGDGMSVYGASKRGVHYLTAALRKDLGDSPVRVGVLSPGIVVTDLLMGDYEDHPERLEEAKRIFNILGDHIEPVTAWLADGIVAGRSELRWLTRRKAAVRFATASFRKRDLFAEA